MPRHYDFIVAGSGVTGGRLAQYLTEGSAYCLLLEAGEALVYRSPENESVTD
jgi:choline dehydrogenase-like flavoprotein